MSWIGSIIAAIIGLFTGRTRKAGEQLGAEEAANKQLREGQRDIEAANEAAKKVEKDAADEKFDPNDRDDPRNAGRKWM